MDTSKVSSKWQVVIPRSVREAEQIHVGSTMAFERTTWLKAEPRVRVHAE